LNDLVAPIALYPDPLLSQVLVAATYPLEVVQAYQWAQKNTGMGGPALTQAAQQQNWDASVQALAVFPDVLKRLNDDVAWTTNLGNAFLAQQQDVMDAVQRMRQKAQQAGKLQSTAQENVVTTTDAGQPYIDIEPANPEVIYVPVYDPVARLGRMGLASGMGQPLRDREQYVHPQVQLQRRQRDQRARDLGVGARRDAPRGRAVCQPVSANAVSRECAAEHGAPIGGPGADADATAR